MNFKYIENDPMDEVKSPVGKLILTFVGCTSIFVAYMMMWGSFLSV